MSGWKHWFSGICRVHPNSKRGDRPCASDPNHHVLNYYRSHSYAFYHFSFFEHFGFFQQETQHQSWRWALQLFCFTIAEIICSMGRLISRLDATVFVMIFVTPSSLAAVFWFRIGAIGAVPTSKYHVSNSSVSSITHFQEKTFYHS